jgi:propionyl-CoA carboxylase alpha chain
VRRIARLLVANRGEIARRIFRTAGAMGIATVAVFSASDEAMPHAREADEAVRLPGHAAIDTYLRADLILAAAALTGSDAIHPGYGFLAENAAFAASCEEAGLIFVGPPSAAIAAMGSKLSAKSLMSQAGIPVLEGVDATGLDAGALLAAAETVGWPLLVKASAGGGGRGMRVVHSAAELPECAEAARREAAAAFGDGTIFLERYLEGAHHVEIQVLADAGGAAVSLFERDCSVQRRHQKIIEEAPAPIVSRDLRSAMGSQAVAAAQAIGYRGAGTVEFLLMPSGEHYFLEMNTRLQVEHPVTELVTGLDLVRLQILVAEGRPLGEDVLAAAARGPRGHAIEARLYAEDPQDGLRPSTGTLHLVELGAAASPSVRVDSGVETGSVVSHYYDPLLAKVVAHGETRHEAAVRLARVLRQARLHGVATNRDLLVGILTDEEFLAGTADVQFLEREGLDREGLARFLPPPRAGATGGPPGTVDQLHAAAAVITGAAARRRSAPVLAGIPSGWRNNASARQLISFQRADHSATEVAYRFVRGGVEIAVDGLELAHLRVVDASETFLEAELAGVRRRVEVQRVGEMIYLDSPLGSDVLAEMPRFPAGTDGPAEGSLRAPMPGIVSRVEVAAGEDVSAGQLVVVIEAMKMEHPVRAPHAGRVSLVQAQAGDQVEAGDVLAVVEGPP